MRLRGIPTFGPGICAEYFNCTFESKENCYKGSKCVFVCVERKIETERQRQDKAGGLERREFSSQVLKNTTHFQEVETAV